jgi:ATP-dependent RNA helicase HelY
MSRGRRGGTAPDAPLRADGFRERYEAGLAFTLDDFQVRALDALDRGESVLVAAPTGSGKTLVAEYAAARALERSGKTFYTTPIKALSNQKFAELAARYGEERVGLLTGDVSHQARAPMVVMTTEVLRNMLFARSSLLEGLAVVVLAEVYYL